ncbi:MAG: hypothetical protein AAB605_03030 [Patescibacteria group bacterium]
MTIPLTIRIVLLGGLASVVILAFGLRTEAIGFTYATGDGFTLKIDSEAYWNGVPQDGTNGTSDSTWGLKNLNPHSDKFFNLRDVKPGDRGEATISLHVNMDAWLCLDFERLRERENGRNEPESHVDNSGGASSGELADGTEFFGWFDDGDNIFEIGEVPIFGTTTGKQAATITLNQKTYALADSKGGAPFTASTTRYIGIQWCAGDLTVNLVTGVIGCDGEALGNEAQTDSFSVDISFRAVATSTHSRFVCTKQGTTCEWPGPVNINVNNNAVVNSTTTSSSNTGGNSAGSGGTVITGDATSTATSTNIINQVRLLFGR